MYVKLWAGVCPWDIICEAMGWCLSMGYMYLRLWAGTSPWAGHDSRLACSPVLISINVQLSQFVQL